MLSRKILLQIPLEVQSKMAFRHHTIPCSLITNLHMSRSLNHSAYVKHSSHFYKFYCSHDSELMLGVKRKAFIGKYDITSWTETVKHCHSSLVKAICERLHPVLFLVILMRHRAEKSLKRLSAKWKGHFRFGPFCLTLSAETVQAIAKVLRHRKHVELGEVYGTTWCSYYLDVSL